MATISGWSSTAGSNTTVGGVNIDEGWASADINNAIRAVMAAVKETFPNITTAIAADSTELGYLDGTVAGAAVASKVATLGANKNLDEFHTAALYLGAGAGTQVTATAADLNAIVDAAGNIGFSGTETTITGGLTVTGTITNPGSAKAWAVVQSTGTLVVGHNITSAAKDSTGQYTVTWDANFSSANYATLVVPWVEGNANARSAIVLQQDAGACTVQTRSGAPALIDCGFMIVAFGTLA